LNEDIKNLMDLQAIDLQIQQLDEKVATGVDELNSRNNSIEEHKASIEDYKERLESGEKRHRELEGQITDEEARLKDRQTKLMSVQTNREYQSLLKEIEDTKQANKQREDELVLLMEQTESIKNKIEELTTLCQNEQDSLTEQAEKVKSAAQTISNKRNKIEKTRDKQAKKVNGKFLKRYEMLRERRNGLAVAGVTRGVCRGCNMNIPPQLFNNLLREDEILSCPTCNRMMYHLAESDEEE